MDELSRLYEEVHDLTALISLICERPPDLEGYCKARGNGVVVRDSSPFDSPEYEDNTESEAVDEIATGTSEHALATLKPRVLDRLAEILARFKTAKIGKVRGKIPNPDAKHVASVAMVEDHNHGRVTIFCSKNEGLDAGDKEFLERLSVLLKNISGNRDMNEDHLDSVFDIVFDHQRPRVDFYSDALRRAFNEASRNTVEKILTEEVVEHMFQHPLQPWEWEGLHINNNPHTTAEIPVFKEAVESFSDQKSNSTVAEVWQEIQSLFGSPNPNSPHPSRTKNLLRGLYTIMRHRKQRPRLKNYLRQAFHGDKNIFRRAWNSLLFLARILHGAITLVQFALEQKSLTSFEFIPVPARMFRARRSSSETKLPLEVLTAVGCLPGNERWLTFFRNEKTIQDYNRRRRFRATVHAEVQMIYFLETRSNIPQAPTGEVFRYIGCSRKCCFFCKAFLDVYGKFAARGTHETVFPRWALPQEPAAKKELGWSVEPMCQFLKSLKDILQQVLNKPYPLPHRDLLQQSSAALSTARAVDQKKLSHSVRPSMVTKLIFPLAVCATDRQVQFAPSPGRPGYATFLAPSMPHLGLELPVEQAETYKINHDRERCSLERMDQMPPKNISERGGQCRLCHKPAKGRCSNCWTWYCTRVCQKRDWSAHVFKCRIRNRPNAVDYLRLIVRRVKKTMITADPEKIHDSLLELFADDHICRSFGFNNCSSPLEALNLVCLYDTVISKCRSPVKVLHKYLEDGKLGDCLAWFCLLRIAQTGGRSECDCMSWYLACRATRPFPIPNPDKDIYEIWHTAIYSTISCLGISERMEDGPGFSRSQSEVFGLFAAIQPTLWRVPDIYTSTWINFGFCYCRTFQQRKELAAKYLALASSDATFDEIVSAYEASTMAELMKAQGIDISNLERQGIRLHRPPPCHFAVFRLMTGVAHALSGRYCDCFRVREGRSCHGYFETHLDLESDISYGFHLSNSWERWQLLNFYNHLFKFRDFDPRAMAEAKDSQERGSLERYLDTLVPDMRRKVFNMDRAGSILFPYLDGRVTVQPVDGERAKHSHLPCNCKVHGVIGPPGISRLRANQIIDC